MKYFVTLLFVSTALHAQVVAFSGKNVVVAHDRRIDLFDPSGHTLLTSEGVSRPSQVAVDASHIAVIDSLANEVAMVNTINRQHDRFRTGETPVDIAFVRGDLFVLDRDAARVEKYKSLSVDVAADPSFVRAANNMLYVYSRLEGIVQEIDPATLRITRTIALPPFASDFEVDASTGYLVYPRDARLRTFSLETMQRSGDIAAGVVPVDIAIASRANALSASRLAIADPSAKRVWMVEGEQSVAKAVVRGFLRGLLGLGLFRPKSSQFPTGVDRVLTRGSVTVAYDSSSETLYRVNGAKSTVVAHGIGPAAFAVGENVVAVWENGALRLIR